MMSEMKKMNPETLDKVIGGVQNIVYNDASGYAYAQCREEPGLSSKVLFTIPNGTEVFPTGNVVNKDGYDWYEIKLSGAYECGWIAGSLIGY